MAFLSLSPASFSRCPIVASSNERKALFNRISGVYDNGPHSGIFRPSGPSRLLHRHLNDLLTLGQHRIWKRMAVSWSGARRGDMVLDVCCGSGDLTFLVSEKVGLEGRVTGLDFSREQLSVASARQGSSFWKACYKNIMWIEGDALDLPFPECSFDAITIGYGLRNVVDKPAAMQEVFRVLKPGSRVSILDFNKSSNSSITFIQEWIIDNVVVPAASNYGLEKEYAYLKGSIQNFLTGKELEELAKEVGFSKARHYEIGGGIMGTLVATR